MIIVVYSNNIIYCYYYCEKPTSSRTGEPESVVANNILQSLCLILHRENARAILRRRPCQLSGDGVDILTAAVTATA